MRKGFACLLRVLQLCAPQVNALKNHRVVHHFLDLPVRSFSHALVVLGVLFVTLSIAASAGPSRLNPGVILCL